MTLDKEKRHFSADTTFPVMQSENGSNGHSNLPIPERVSSLSRKRVNRYGQQLQHDLYHASGQVIEYDGPESSIIDRIFLPTQYSERKSPSPRRTKEQRRIEVTNQFNDIGNPSLKRSLTAVAMSLDEKQQLIPSHSWNRRLREGTGISRKNAGKLIDFALNHHVIEHQIESGPKGRRIPRITPNALLALTAIASTYQESQLGDYPATLAAPLIVASREQLGEHNLATYIHDPVEKTRSPKKSTKQEHDESAYRKILIDKYSDLPDPSMAEVLVATEMHLREKKVREEIPLMRVPSLLQRILGVERQQVSVIMKNAIRQGVIKTGSYIPENGQRNIRTVDTNTLLGLVGVVHKVKENEDTAPLLSTEFIDELRSEFVIPEIIQSLHNPQTKEKKRHKKSGKRTKPTPSPSRAAREEKATDRHLHNGQSNNLENNNKRAETPQIRVPKIEIEELTDLSYLDSATLEKKVQQLEGKEGFEQTPAATVMGSVSRVTRFVSAFLRDELSSYDPLGLDITVSEDRRALRDCIASLKAKADPNLPNPTLDMLFGAVLDIVKEQTGNKKKAIF